MDADAGPDEAILLKLALHPEHAESFFSWVEGLSRRQTEVEASVAAEGISAESVFRDGPATAFIHQHCADLVHASTVAATSTVPLDVETRAMFEKCVKSVTPLPRLFQTPD